MGLNGLVGKMSRITEKRIYRVEPIAITSDGTNVGRITIPDTSIFMVGQIVILRSNVAGPQMFKINRIDPIDHINMWLGPVKEHISKRSDLSSYLVADNAVIEANEQERPSVPEQEIERHTYEEEPTVARRVVIVDKWGCRIDSDNPLPVNATISTSSSGTPTIFNVQASLKNTQYSQTLPNNTTQFSVKARNAAKLQLSYVSGTTNSNFLTITPGTIYEVEAIKLTGTTIYFQASKDNTVIEIVTWN